MLGYTVIGVTDLDRAAAFYDQLFAPFGGKRALEVPGGYFYAFGKGQPMFAIRRPYDGKAQHHGNGNMIALNVGSTEKVHAMYDQALKLGGTDEGPPGPRTAGAGFYGGYFRDLDGNKLCAFTIVAA